MRFCRLHLVFFLLFLTIANVSSRRRMGHRSSKLRRKNLHPPISKFPLSPSSSKSHSHGASLVDRPLNSFIESLSGFTNNLYREIIRQGTPGDNKVFSPYGLNVLLGMLYAGAAGETSAEMRNAMELTKFDDYTIFEQYQKIQTSLNSQSSIKLLIANKIFPQKELPLEMLYTAILQYAFDAEIERLEFSERNESASKINAWIKEKTDDTVQDFISPDDIDDSTDLIAANAIYFDGKWKIPFSEPQFTKSERFYLNPLDEQDTFIYMSFMSRLAYLEYGELQDLGGAEAISLPYVGGRFTMIALLPNKTLGIRDLERRIGLGYDLTTVPASLEYRNVNLYFPKFKIETTINYTDHNHDILNNLGLTLLASDRADMKLLTDMINFKVTNVIQKTILEISEDGTESDAAILGNLVPYFLVHPRIKTLEFNRPFIGYIMDLKTKVIMFMFKKAK